MEYSKYMKVALEAANSTIGQTAPNPAVGAIVVKKGTVLGIGAHLKAGMPHAEVYALEMAGEEAKGADLFVTLEPCSHHGKTPPCADLIIERGIRRVFIASMDPNPLVSGKGVEKLQQSGIKVEFGLCEQEALDLNKVFFHTIRTGLPYVTLKTATTLDGKIATVSEESKWITGEEARADVQWLRHRHDAILVGVETIIKDNPSLTARIPGGGRNPIRVILDSTLRIPMESIILHDGAAKVIVVTGKNYNKEKLEKLTEIGVEVIQQGEPKPEISSTLRKLGLRGITSLLVEGGAEIQGSFLKAQAFQEVIAYLAPKLFGGSEARTVFGGEGFSSIEDAPSLIFKKIETIGKDIKITAEPIWG
ncbi:bifunctional diaminohydroxyphosphoribosylaminopyrimidine deaminase/5-amino-6-(5-phosphoribosylamino)uracil reductase RibD [Bacillus massilinigeriensis]|uniref:bifunctional diaminohydroxyphosphoribosylaminopyrimidine deaminase/5-amino-6-(5-phosphoribosylamino)uracil reductase RibD n=1 Tax=Bacillus mediterraneensis TaxID=1805474 RepID=UPI0008F8FA77|nr:bifunctional diaminohydroxyphosphoribosylaminopyrimidine deaminase/5-amino-6-(5-phosphoribosylamino)uracil reductase RibD [Bacillus mediterraneensis]